MNGSEMTDSGIIKALECHSEGCTDNCPLEDDYPFCKDIITDMALDLIKRQKAEIERLNNNIAAMAVTLSNSARATRTEAIKEFAESVKQSASHGGNKSIEEIMHEMIG